MDDRASSIIRGRTTLLQGDVLNHLMFLPTAVFDCVVTSPPYWGLRDYGVEGQIGAEPTLLEYISNLVMIFHEMRRTLKPTATFWLNIGDSYAGGGRGSGSPDSKQRTNVGSLVAPSSGSGLAAKNLCMVPNRLAIALQDDGWFVRSEIIWHKPNPMPESITDRPTCSHEKIWLLTKSSRYFYDFDAIKEAANPRSSWTDASEKQRGHSRRHAGFNGRYADKIREFGPPPTRNARNVWTIAPRPYRGAHFATFPPELVERCVRAGCPLGGHVLDPFGGSGTTAMVASRLGRDATMIEINPDYIEMARRRIAEGV